MKYIFAFLILTGCCSAPTIQTVQLADTLKIPDVTVEFQGKGQIMPVYITDTIRVSDTGKTVQKLSSLNVSKDTTIDTNDGLISLSARYQWPNNVWQFRTAYKPNPILPGTEVQSVIKQKEPSWKEVYFWQIVSPFVFFSVCFLILIASVIRKAV